jgi:mono/diheme cytochrome c family protein
MAFFTCELNGGDMKGWVIARLMLGTGLGVAVAAAAIGVAAAQLKELPPGPNRELVSQQCQACHDLDNVLGGAGATREAWDGAIDQMVGYGMNVSPEQRAMILEYLATYLGPGSSPPAAARP